jgi:fumarate hydratase, class I
MENLGCNLKDEIVELIRLASTNLPPEVLKTLEDARQKEEPASAAFHAMETIIKNVGLSQIKSTPICQDTGTPIFFVSYPEGWNLRLLRSQVRTAVAEATKKSFLRPNAVDALRGKNTGDNLGDEFFPTIHFEEAEGERLTIDLILKGGGCENVGAQYSLPDDRLKAGRDLEGVRKAVLDAVFQAQGLGCAPGFLGVAIGGDRNTAYLVSKKALLRKFGEINPDPELADLEERITRESNELRIGPMGFGGNSTILATRILATYRVPASFFVTISYMCWAYRHKQMIVDNGKVIYE